MALRKIARFIDLPAWGIGLPIFIALSLGFKFLCPYLPFWCCFVIVLFGALLNGFVMDWEDDQYEDYCNRWYSLKFDEIDDLKVLPIFPGGFFSVKGRSLRVESQGPINRPTIQRRGADAILSLEQASSSPWGKTSQFFCLRFRVSKGTRRILFDGTDVCLWQNEAV